MPNKYIPYPMVLGTTLIGMLGLREDQIDYFNIPDTTTAENELVAYEGSIKAHRRNIHSDRLKDTAPSRTITVNRVAVVDRRRRKLSNARGGKPIKVPTELTSTPATSSTAANPTPRTPSIRFTTIKFPGSASNAEISRWLYLKMAAHKPKFFITPAGASFPITSAALVAPPTGAGTAS